MSNSPSRPYRCPETLAHVDEFIDGELCASECDRIDQHLAVCAGCRAVYSREMRLKQLVAKACACRDVPADLRSRVLTTINAIRVSTENATFESVTIRTEIRRDNS